MGTGRGPALDGGAVRADRLGEVALAIVLAPADIAALALVRWGVAGTRYPLRIDLT